MNSEKRTTLPFTEEEVFEIQERLDTKLDASYLSYRPAAQGTVAYLEGWRSFNLANEVFGFNGWSSEILSFTIDFTDIDANGKISLGMSCMVRVYLRDGTYHDDIGYGSADNQKSKAAAYEKAKKEAVTDGMKRALRMFGNRLGNCAYDKNFLKDIKNVRPNSANTPISPPFRPANYPRIPKNTVNAVNNQDFFNFLEAKRDEIQAAFIQQSEKEAEEVDLKDTSNTEQAEQEIIQSQNLELQDIMTIERELEDYNYTSVNTTPNPKAKCIQPTFKSSQDQNNLQLAWSTSLETPGSSSHKDTDTTMIMGQLTLKDDDEFGDIEDLDGLDELIEDYCDYDLDLDFDMEQEISSSAQEDPLGLDSLAFPMSQFPGSDAGSLELNDDMISDFDLNKDADSEFELDISMSQFPSTQVAMQSATEKEKQADDTSTFVVPPVIGFTTGRGAAMPPPSKEAMKRARSLVELDEQALDQFTDEKENKENVPMDNVQAQPFPMFTTGRGKAIAPPTEEAIKRARSMIENDNFDLDLKPELEPEFPAFPAFTTAKGKTLPPPSKEALDRASKLINDEAETTPLVDNVPMMVGFSTGRGKAMKPPSEEALKRAQELVSDFTESSKTINAPKIQNKPVPAKKPLVPGNTAFKPHNIRPTSTNTGPPVKPFSLSNAWKRPRPRSVVPAAQKSVTVPPSPLPKLFDLNTEGMTRFKLRDFFKTPPNSNIKEYHSYGM